MENISRRHVLRLFGGAASAGIVGASAVPGSGLLAPAHAAGGPLRTNISAILAAGTPLIGMSAPPDLWSQRCAEVGRGLTARRIFADLGRGATHQLNLVGQAHDAGLLPVISYKVGGDAAGAVNGRFNKVAAEAAAKLAAFNKPTAVTFWHEPHGDLTPAQYVAASKQILPSFKRDKLKVGPILNGWLLDRQLSTFASYAPNELFKLWDWFGIDTYETGTMENPGDVKPADRIPKMAKFVNSRLPLAVGEYNGYSAKSIADAGEALLSTKGVWFGCVWNATGGVGYVLEGERLQAFKRTLADPRAAEPTPA
jgi:hypothetical protein